MSLPAASALKPGTNKESGKAPARPQDAIPGPDGINSPERAAGQGAEDRRPEARLFLGTACGSRSTRPSGVQ